MDAKSKKNRATLSVSMEAKMMLDSIRRIGQSYDGLIRELVGFRKKKGTRGQSGGESTRRR